MEINDKIIEVLESNKIDLDEGLTYLLSIYFNLNPSYIPDEVKQKVIASKIIINDNELIWLVPLFIGGNAGAFEWVKEEYTNLFRLLGKQPHNKECLTRMKRLFSENPDIRKEEVLEATRTYIAATPTKYIREPHYFITKGVGLDRISDLLTWIYKIREEETVEHKGPRIL